MGVRPRRCTGGLWRGGVGLAWLGWAGIATRMSWLAEWWRGDRSEATELYRLSRAGPCKDPAAAPPSHVSTPQGAAV